MSPADESRRTSRFDRARRVGATAAALWGAVFLVICTTGQRLSTEYLGFGWQLIPYEILSDDPIRSVWYLHIQPPLWNLVVGMIGKFSPLPDGISFLLLQAGFGMVAAGLLAIVLLRLRCRPWLAVAFALLGTANPEYVRNAFEPTYEMAVGCGLIALAWAVTLPDRSDGEAAARRGRAFVAVSAVATAVVLRAASTTRSGWSSCSVWPGGRGGTGSTAGRSRSACSCPSCSSAGGWPRTRSCSDARRCRRGSG
ncbi:MAG: hypothetical protein R2705_00105 [Ilumatobacteraceae bacterium]